MTSNNPFTDRIHTAAQEGYVNQGYIRNGRTTYVPNEPNFAAPARTTTDKQFELIVNLLDERDLAAETRPKFRARTAQLARDNSAILELDRAAASNLITYLFGLPQASGTIGTPAAFAEVPAGHYAIIVREETVFLQVDRPTEGKWAGKVFVKLQHGDEFTNMGRVAGDTMLGRIIDQGIVDCSIRYGRLIGRCGVCHRTLTNEESRSAGIGPICAEKFGM